MHRKFAVAATTLVAGLAAAAPASASASDSTPLPVVGQQFTYFGTTCTVDAIATTDTSATGTATCATRFGTFRISAAFDATTGKVVLATVKLA